MCPPGIDESTAMATHSWLKSSAMIKQLMRLLLLNEPLTKSRLRI